jgi:hypothetical protein
MEKADFIVSPTYEDYVQTDYLARKIATTILNKK